MTAWLDADWPAPPGLRALTTTRHGLGVSQPPFDSFNLGIRCGDDADAVIENRRQLEAALSLPASPHWLKQVHGIEVLRFAPSLSPQASRRDRARHRRRKMVSGTLFDFSCHPENVPDTILLLTR